MKKVLMFFLIVTLSMCALATEIKVSLAKDIPPDVISESNGLLIDLINEMNKLPGDVKFKVIGIFPFKRSINNVETGVADLHLPLLKDPRNSENLSFAYTDEEFTEVPFILYTNAENKKVNKSNIKDFNVRVQLAHKEFFPEVKGEMPIEGGLRRLQTGEIDGFICAMISGDEVIKKYNMTNIESQLMENFSSNAIVAKNQNGEEANKLFSEALRKLKENSQLYNIYPKVQFKTQ